ncbi:MAG: hypothetical protein IKU30_03390 [Clostridia bacterium]|nr:hypothetical protein [Clostridia bacterium]
MTEYISKDAIIKAIKKKYCDECKRINKGFSSPKFCSICRVTDDLDIIGKLPAADVRENVRGEWILAERVSHDRGLWECSHCHKWVWGIAEDKPTQKFCDNCGADMRDGNMEEGNG